MAQPNDNVFVGDLPDWMTKEHFEAMMSGYGTVVSTKVMPPKMPGGKASGLVRFASVQEATWVVTNLNGNLAEGLEEPVVVKFAHATGSAGSWAAGGGAWQSPAKGGAKGGKAALGGYGCWSAAAEGGKGGKGGAPTPGDNVFVGDLPVNCTQEFFEQLMSQYGTVVSCRVLQPKVPGGKASGLVRFISVEEATWVVENLNGNLAEGLQEPVKVRFANAPGSKGSDGGKGAGAWAAPGGRPSPYGGKGAAKGGGKGGNSFYFLYGAIKKAGLLGPKEAVPDDCQVFVKNLPADTTDLDLYRLFAPFGTIAPTGVKAMMNEDGTCKGIGFVDFADPSFAVGAVNTLNGFAMEDGSWLGVSQKKGSTKGAKGAGKSAGKSKGGM